MAVAASQQRTPGTQLRSLLGKRISLVRSPAVQSNKIAAPDLEKRTTAGGLKAAADRAVTAGRPRVSAKPTKRKVLLDLLEQVEHELQTGSQEEETKGAASISAPSAAALAEDTQTESLAPQSPSCASLSAPAIVMRTECGFKAAEQQQQHDNNLELAENDEDVALELEARLPRDCWKRAHAKIAMLCTAQK